MLSIITDILLTFSYIPISLRIYDPMTHGFKDSIICKCNSLIPNLSGLLILYPYIPKNLRDKDKAMIFESSMPMIPLFFYISVFPILLFLSAIILLNIKSQDYEINLPRYIISSGNICIFLFQRLESLCLTES